MSTFSGLSEIIFDESRYLKVWFNSVLCPLLFKGLPCQDNELSQPAPAPEVRLIVLL